MLQLEKLIIRLPNNHPKYEYINKKYHQLQAGFAGELYVDRLLHEISYPQGIRVLKDVSLEVNPHFQIQIDTLIISPNQIFLLEIKNYAGTVHFDELSGKTTKISYQGDVDKYDCIIHQLDRTTFGFQTWLQKQGISTSILPILVMANSQTDIPVFPETVSLKYAKQLPRFIRGLLSEEKQSLQSQFASIAHTIESKQIKWPHIPACQRYEISPSELKKGVLCSTCHVPMARYRGHSWFCQVCRKKDPSALGKSIEDWFLLIDSTISNKQLRAFLKLKSSSAASVIFHGFKMQRHGNTPHTFYTMGRSSQT